MKKTTEEKQQYIYFSEIKYKVLKFISSFVKQKEYSPTFAEVAKKFKFSRARAGKTVGELHSLGFIYKGKASHRKIRMNEYHSFSIPSMKFNREYPVVDVIK